MTNLNRNIVVGCIDIKQRLSREIDELRVNVHHQSPSQPKPAKKASQKSDLLASVLIDR
jgi:hypothetical protein